MDIVILSLVLYKAIMETWWECCTDMQQEVKIVLEGRGKLCMISLKGEYFRLLNCFNHIPEVLYFPMKQKTFMLCKLWDKDRSKMPHASSHFATKNDNFFHKPCHRSLFLKEIHTIKQYFACESLFLSKIDNKSQILVAP